MVSPMRRAARTVAAPVTNGVVFEIQDTDGALVGAAYSNSTRTQTVALTRPADAAEQAKKEFQQELEIDPSNAGAEYVLGELAREAQQWDEAVKHFTRAAKLDSSFGDAYLGWGVALVSTKKFSEAVPPLELAVKLEPQNPAAHYNLAVAYTRTGRKQEGEREFAIHRDMVQKNPPEEKAPEGQAAPSPQ